MQAFPEENAAVQLQLVTAAVKLFLKSPQPRAQQMIQLVLTYATQVCGPCPIQLPLCTLSSYGTACLLAPWQPYYRGPSRCSAGACSLSPDSSLPSPSQPSLPCMR